MTKAVRRKFCLLILLSIVGCQETNSQSPVSPALDEPLTPVEALAALDEPAKAADDAPVPDLRQRKFGEDWPRFLGPRANSTSTEQGILTKWAGQGPPRLWQLPLGESYGTVATSLGRLFVFDRVDNKARLRCRESETGKPLWAFQYETDYRDSFGYNGGPRCAPVVDGRRVYVYGAEGMLHCLDVTDGELQWKRNLNRDYGVLQNFFGVGSCPVIHDDLLLVIVGGSDKASQRLPPLALDRAAGNGSGIVAFNKRTGEEVYRFSDELASYSTPVVTTMFDRPRAFAFTRGGLLAFHPDNGRQDFFFPWRSPKLESVNASSPVVVGDQVLISETYGPGTALLQVKPDGYEVVWQDDDKQRARAMQTHWNTPIHVGGYLYGSSGRHQGNAELRCIDWKTGKVQWSEPGLTRCSLLLVDGHFLCLGEEGTLRLLKVNPAKYDEVASVMLTDPQTNEPLLTAPAWAAPILSHGLLYVRGKDRLVCLELIAPPE